MTTREIINMVKEQRNTFKKTLNETFSDEELINKCCKMYSDSMTSNGDEKELNELWHQILKEILMERMSK